MTTALPAVHIYYSNMQHENRLLRAAAAAVDAQLASRVVGIGYHEEGLAETEVMAEAIVFRRLKPPSWLVGRGKIARLIRWPAWTIAAARVAARERPAFVQAHSLAAMPAAIIAARVLGKSKIVYDAHELETERTGWSPALKRVARVAERFFLKFADLTIVVSGSIARWYGRAYGIAPPLLVRNLPEGVQGSSGQPLEDIRTRLRLSEQDMIFVYLGKLGDGRGLDILVDAFRNVGPGRHLVILGDGPSEDRLRVAAKERPNIHVLAPLPAAQVIDFIKSADVGLSLIEDVSLSYRYCLPNKLFETRLAGLPAIVSDLEEMRAFVEEYGGGWVVEPKVEAVLSLVSELTRDDARHMITTAKPTPIWADDRDRYTHALENLVGR